MGDSSPIFTLASLAVVLLIAFIKELSTERLRAATDTTANQKQCSRVLIDESRTEGISYKEISIQCQEIKVGDIIRIRDEETIPADCIILA